MIIFIMKKIDWEKYFQGIRIYKWNTSFTFFHLFHEDKCNI